MFTREIKKRIAIVMAALSISGATLFGADIRTTTPLEAKQEQEAHYLQNGKYIPRNETELSKGISVQTYESPDGDGFFIVQETDLEMTITDFGKGGFSQTVIKQASTSPRFSPTL